MGRIVRVELKLYAEGEDKEDIIEELNRIFRESPSLILSSIKAIDVIPDIDIKFEEVKSFEKKMFVEGDSSIFYKDLLAKGKGKYLEMKKRLEDMKKEEKICHRCKMPLKETDNQEEDSEGLFTCNECEWELGQIAKEEAYYSKDGEAR